MTPTFYDLLRSQRAAIIDEQLRLERKVGAIDTLLEDAPAPATDDMMPKHADPAEPCRHDKYDERTGRCVDCYTRVRAPKYTCDQCNDTGRIKTRSSLGLGYEFHPCACRRHTPDADTAAARDGADVPTENAT